MVPNRIRSRCLFPALLLLASGAAHAGAAEDAAQVFLQDAARHLGNDVTVTVPAPEVALPPCTDPQPFLPGHDQRLLDASPSAYVAAMARPVICRRASPQSGNTGWLPATFRLARW